MASSAKPARTTPLYPQLHPRRNGHTREEVASNQRARLFGAMIATVAERGYAASAVSELCSRAGVSKRTVYDHFPSKEAYFFATYDLLVYRVHERVRAAYESAREAGLDPVQRLGPAFAAVAGELCERPDAAGLMLIEAWGAGPGSLEHVERAAGAFERLLLGALEQTSQAGAPDPLLVKGLVGGIVWTLRLELGRAPDASHERSEEGRSGEPAPWPEILDRLRRWVLDYRWPVPVQPGSGGCLGLPGRAHGGLASPGSLAPAALGGAGRRDEPRSRLLRGALRVAAWGGGAELTVAQIAQTAECSHDEFFACFEDGEQCLIEAAREHVGEIRERVAGACAGPGDWADGVLVATRALLEGLAGDPELARVVFVEMPAVGQSGTGSGVALLDELASGLIEPVLGAGRTSAGRLGVGGNGPLARRRDELVARATVGAVWEVIRHYVVHGAVEGLPDLADRVGYLVLCPVVGAGEAIEAISRARGSTAESELEAIARGEGPRLVGLAQGVL